MIQPDPSEAEINLRTETAQSVLSMFGIPGGLFGATGDSDARESWRRFILGTMAPVLKVCESELRIKLDRPELTLSLDGLRAGDLQGRARATAARALAVRNLVTAGLSVEDARARRRGSDMAKSALDILPLDLLKQELRIPDGVTSQDDHARTADREQPSAISSIASVRRWLMWLTSTGSTCYRDDLAIDLRSPCIEVR